MSAATRQSRSQSAGSSAANTSNRPISSTVTMRAAARDRADRKGARGGHRHRHDLSTLPLRPPRHGDNATAQAHAPSPLPPSLRGASRRNAAPLRNRLTRPTGSGRQPPRPRAGVGWLGRALEPAGSQKLLPTALTLSCGSRRRTSSPRCDALGCRRQALRSAPHRRVGSRPPSRRRGSRATSARLARVGWDATPGKSRITPQKHRRTLPFSGCRPHLSSARMTGHPVLPFQVNAGCPSKLRRNVAKHPGPYEHPPSPHWVRCDSGHRRHHHGERPTA